MSNTIEGILFVYGKPGSWPDFAVATKEAAINAAQKAKDEGKIIDYRIEEETSTTGKIIATIEPVQELGDLANNIDPSYQFPADRHSIFCDCPKCQARWK